MNNPKTQINNSYRATRPRHLLGNDPRKLVTHYEAHKPATLMSYIIATIGGLVVGLTFAVALGVI